MGSGAGFCHAMWTALLSGKVSSKQSRNMSSRGQDKSRALQRWLAEERAHASAVDRMLLKESQRRRTLRDQSRIGRRGWSGR